ncbi:MAG: M23 family metallopeptidase [Candidatus Gracilibacteria bacterium]|nr:M23 family metallopeptidase [Candidatus Gracilibacteria bacterium]
MINKNLVGIWILIISFLSVCFGYTLVFAGNIGEIKFKLSNNIFFDSLNLSKNMVIIESRENLSNLKISGDCSVTGKMVEHNANFYVFELFLADEKCDKKTINAVFSKGDLLLNASFNLTTPGNLYNTYLDFSSEKLEKYLKSIEVGITKLSSYSSYNKTIHKDKYDFLDKNRNLQELMYMKTFISDILSKRNLKYAVPIKGSNLPTLSSKMPNVPRPYRSEYTSGIHEGWDFDADYGETVVSIDYGIVVRVIDNFSFADLDKLKTTGELTKDDKVKNLDILRGNQVWIKTMRGDVVFYSHLSEVYSNIKVGDVVFKGQALGAVGITGVPDKNYTDYHVHVEFRENPHNDTRKTSYSIDEYMNWDWYFKGKSEKYILENEYNIFEKNEK